MTNCIAEFADDTGYDEAPRYRSSHSNIASCHCRLFAGVPERGSNANGDGQTFDKCDERRVAEFANSLGVLLESLVSASGAGDIQA